MRTDYQAHIYYFDNGLDSMQAAATLALLSNRYDLVVLGVHNYNRFPAGHFGVSAAARWLISRLQQQQQTITLFFGNPYLIRDFCDAKTLLSCYDDTEITQVAAADLLRGRFTAAGRLPVSVCPSLPGGTGIVPPLRTLPVAAASALGFHPEKLLAIDSLCRDAIAKEATPGCVVLVARAGRIAYQKAFGYLSYEKTELAYPQTIYDLASVTKICATTLAVMKLYEGGNLDLKKTLGDYLPELIGSNKEHLNIYDVLLHQAGLKAFIPFYQETIDKSREGYPLASVYSARPNSLFRIRVADNLYMRANWLDTMFSRIRVSELGPTGRYIYSDNDFILMGKVVEAISGNRLDQYMQEHFYQPMAMTTTGYRPRDRFPLDRIAPTERELTFRRQLLRGDVHDPGAAMFGGVSGHAGLFSDAYDLALLAQMLLNGGVIDGQRLLNRETIDLFTAYHSDSSRRGLGFDKPEKDNPTRKDPYPCLSASSLTFGHTGFTGTCLWVDPKYQLIFIFLSNRVNPSGSNQLSLLNVRGNIMEAIYKSMDVYGKNDQ